MSKRPLAVAVVVLAVLAVVVWRTEQQPPPDPDAPETTEPFEGVGAGDVARLQLGPTGKGVVLVRDGDAWALDGQPPKPAETAMANLAVRSLLDLQSLRALGDAADPAAFGLGPAAPTATATLTDGRTLTLRVGDPAPVGGGRYASIDGAVHLVEPAAVAPLLRDPLDFRDRRLLPVDRDAVERIALRCGEESVALRRDDAGWWLDGEGAYRADSAAVQSLLLDLVDLRARSYGGAPFEPACTVELAAGTAAAVLSLGAVDEQGRRAVVADGAPLPPGLRNEYAYVDAARLGDLEVDPAAWRATELLDFNPFLVTAIEWEAAGRTWSLAKEGAWTLGTGEGEPSPQDEAPVLALLQDLDGLTSVGYPDPAAAEDAVEAASIRLTQSDGLVVEVTLLRGVSRDFARVEGEPALREVASDLHELIGAHAWPATP
jgi:hypothetical protein